MFKGLFTDLVDFDRDIYRNIATCTPSQDLFDDLSDDDEDWQYAIAAESAASSKRPPALIQRPFDYGKVISFPYISQNWQKTRFSDGLDYGVWYGSLTMETTLYETVYHWTRFINASFSNYTQPVSSSRRIFLAKGKGLLVDLRDKVKDFPALRDKHNYTFTHAVGRYVHEQSQNGILCQSARHQGSNTAIFKPGILSDIRDHKLLDYHWQPGDSSIAIKAKNKHIDRIELAHFDNVAQES